MDTKFAIVYAILVVIFIEFFSCMFADWCVGDPRRDHLNATMFAVNFAGAFAAFAAVDLLVTPRVTINETNVIVPPSSSPATPTATSAPTAEK